MENYLLPLHYNEFLTWYRLGSNRVLSARLIPVECSADGHPMMNDVTTAQVVDALPAYEDDWEVLVVLLSHETEGGEPEASYVAYDALDIQAVYPISRRGQRMASNRLESQVYVHEPLCEEAAAAREKMNHRALAFRGGNAVLAYFDLAHHSKSLEQYKDKVWDAIQKRHEETPFPVQDGTFIDNLLCYDRRNPRYPQGDIGFAFDLGKVIIEHCGPDPDFSLLQRYREEGLDVRPDDKLWENLTYFQDHLNIIQEELDIAYRPVGCIAFLQMQEYLRQHFTLSSIEGVHEQLMRLELEDELAFALWLTGCFYDFTPFAPEYYERIKAPFVKQIPAAKTEKVAGEEEDRVNGEADAEQAEALVPATVTGEEDKRVGAVSDAAQGELGLEDKKATGTCTEGNGSTEELEYAIKKFDDLKKIAGVGNASIKKIKDQFESIGDVRSATEDELSGILRLDRARKIHAHFKKELRESVS